ncbi:MAG: SUMF1/EgtB/PvdO family nonheme iron enzyme, partial [Cyanobacteria bacterium P01_F01_bin.33]
GDRMDFPFMERLQWVDFRDPDRYSEAFCQLYYGICGQSAGSDVKWDCLLKIPDVQTSAPSSPASQDVVIEPSLSPAQDPTGGTGRSKRRRKSARSPKSSPVETQASSRSSTPHVGDRIQIHAAARPASLSETSQLLLETIRSDERTITLSPEQITDIARSTPSSINQYRLARIAEWSQPRYRLDKRFVQLSMLIDRGESVRGERWQVREQRIEDLDQLFRDVQSRAMVLLAPPGAGKSTILRRLELDISARALRGEDECNRVSFFIQLNHFRPAVPGGPPPAPRFWLNEQWQRRYPQLPPLDRLLRQGRMVLLLDALNEMPVAGEKGFRENVHLWKLFLSEVLEESPDNRIIFSCRSLDYSAPLSTPTLRVPQVRVEPMSDDKIELFLSLYSPLHWREVLASVRNSPNYELLRSPYFLKLLIDQVEEDDAIPDGRAELLTGFVRQAIRREVERDNPLFEEGDLLTSRDLRQIARWRWKQPIDLPERGTLVPTLSKLAFEMQMRRSSDDASQVRIPYDDALDIVEDADAEEEVLKAGVALSVLDEDTASDELLFYHQLVQEYFAARYLAECPEPDLVATPWRADDVRPSLAEMLDVLDPADPLPPLRSTGWEETVLIASTLVAEPDEFVMAIAKRNLVLAGRCAVQPELTHRLLPSVVAELRRQLFLRSRHPEADLRARIAAGLTLGALGGPLFQHCEGPHGSYLMPEMVAVPAGTYCIGSTKPYTDRGRVLNEEMPECEVELEAFSLGRYPVTNAEWSYFIASGGYNDERWWDTAPALEWLHGRRTSEPSRIQARHWRRLFVADSELMESEFAKDYMDDDTKDRWRERVTMTDEDFEAHLKDCYPGGHFVEPRHWRNPHYNNPMQPIIGISTFEARAYANWLEAQTGLPFRLPTEVEWEAAARGDRHWTFAYGDEFAPLKGNTIETHVHGPTPIGIFVEGDTPDGISELTGNTYDLTESLWGDNPAEPTFRYPYDPNDGREDMNASSDVFRVGKGGCWYLDRTYARVTYRGRDRRDLRADDWLNFRGCRLALTGALPSAEA